jgi:hypothetical protein
MQRLKSWLERAPFALVASLWSLLLTVVLTWPACLDLSSEVLGSEHADTMKHLWTLWWIRAELLSGSIPFQTDLVNYPQGMELYPIEPLNGLVVLLLAPLNIVTAANLAAMLNLTVTGICAALLGRDIAGNRWGGLAAGTLLQGSAIASFTVHVGVGELQHLWWLPLGLLAWRGLRKRMTWGSTLLLGGALAGASLSCFYHGFFLATAVAVLSLATIWAGARTPRLLACYAGAAGLGLLVVVPLTQVFATSYGTEGPSSLTLSEAVFEEHGQPLTDPAPARLELGHLVTPRWGEWSDATRQQKGYAGGRYIGWLALALAVVAMIRDPKRSAPWLAVVVVALLLSLGSILVVSGEELTLESGRRLRLPFLYLNRLLGHVGEGLNFPVRFVALATTALAALAAVAASRVRRPWIVAAVALAATVEVHANQLTPLRLERFELMDYSGLEALSEGTHPTVDIGLALRPDPESRHAALTSQILNGQPLHAVPLERIEYFAPDGAQYVAALPMMDAILEPFTYGRTTELPELRSSLCLLQERGLSRLQLLGTRGSGRIPRGLVLLLNEQLGEPLLWTEAAAVWDIPPATCTDEELDTWRAEQRLRLRHASPSALGPPQR